MGLDRKRISSSEKRSRPGDAEVGNLGLLVHIAPDPVADEVSNHAEAVGLDMLLHGRRDVANPVPGHRLLNTALERLLGDLAQPLGLIR